MQSKTQDSHRRNKSPLDYFNARSRCSIPGNGRTMGDDDNANNDDVLWSFRAVRMACVVTLLILLTYVSSDNAYNELWHVMAALLLAAITLLSLLIHRRNRNKSRSAGKRKTLARKSRATTRTPPPQLLTVRVKDGEDEADEPVAPYEILPRENLKRIDVYIIHCGSDAKRDLAKPLAKIMKLCGVRFFFDIGLEPGSMEPGKSNVKNMQRGLSACTMAVAIFSDHFRDSEHCVKEVNTILLREHEETSTQVGNEEVAILLPFWYFNGREDPAFSVFKNRSSLVRRHESAKKFAFKMARVILVNLGHKFVGLKLACIRCFSVSIFLLLLLVLWAIIALHLFTEKLSLHHVNPSSFLPEHVLSRMQWRRPNEVPLHLLDGAVGRSFEIADLHSNLQAAGGSSAVIVSGTAVRGHAGIGKSTLAALYAAKHNDSYPGGIFWLTAGPEMQTAKQAMPLLQGMVERAYGPELIRQLPDDKVLFSVEEIRSLLACYPGTPSVRTEKPLLVVLDDAWSQAVVKQVREALPTDVSVVLTTRDSRVAAALKGAASVQELGVLFESDAIKLLQHTADGLSKEIARKVAKGLGYHPQAIVLAGGALWARRSHPGSYKNIAEELLKRVKDGTGFGNLPLSDEIEEQTEVEIALKYSYEYLREKDPSGKWQRQFRALGVFSPEADFSTQAASAIWGIPVSEATEFLFMLDAIALIKLDWDNEDRWRQHPILRAYELALSKKMDDDTEWSFRHAQYFVKLIDVCNEKRPRDFERIDREFRQIQHAFTWSKDNDLYSFVQRIANSMASYLQIRGQIDLLREWLELGLRETNDPDRAHSLSNYGELEFRSGHYDGAVQMQSEALASFVVQQNRQGQALALLKLGQVKGRLSSDDDTRRTYEKALALFRETNDISGQANTLLLYGELEFMHKNIEAARDFYREALHLFELVQDDLNKANTILNMAQLESHSGDTDAARRLYDEAMALFVLEQYQLGQANTYLLSGTHELAHGSIDTAQQMCEKALNLFQLVKEPLGNAGAVLCLGTVDVKLETVDAARLKFEEALLMFGDMKLEIGQVRALLSLGDLESSLGNDKQAKAMYERACDFAQVPVVQRFCLLKLAKLEARLGNEEMTRHVLNRAIEVTSKYEGKAEAYMELAKFENCVQNVDSAREMFLEALSLYGLQEDSAGQARALSKLCRIEIGLGNMKSATQLCTRSLSLSLQTEIPGNVDLDEVTQVYGSALIEFHSGRLDSARQLFEKSLKLYKLMSDPIGQANALFHLGASAACVPFNRVATTEDCSGNNDIARQMYHKALPLFENAEDLEGQVRTLAHLVDLEFWTGNFDESRQMVERELRLYEKLDMPIGKALALSNLARLEAFVDGRLEAAAELEAQALSLFVEAGYKKGTESSKELLKIFESEEMREKAMNGPRRGE